MAHPGLVVFDLDFTLWDCGGLWIDCTSHPLKRDDGGQVTDSEGRRFRLYEEALEILEELDSCGVPLGLASRTERPDWAEELLHLWALKDRFLYREIYPGSKVSHFNSLQRATNLGFDEMIFFDDEPRNIEEVSALGVHYHQVTSGVNLDLLRSVLKSFFEKN
ncbi:magnesium-dependent phosphatase-1 [Verrucomicrobiales bacterium]|jgi:magnesium-dependent phosphatase 1|nr:magnesium-dependent phosphatase-1 [Verrucomicrobiales bacterium]MDA7926465.1 magnesium-dependent phosphatase-1 [Verrucomicrobiales bacterium]